MNRCLIKVIGKNVKNFLIKLERNKITCLNINIKNNNEVEILIYEQDFDKLIKLKGIYEIEIIKRYGINEFKAILNKNIHLFVLIIINICLLIVITNYIYEVELIENNKNIANLVTNILKEKGIKKYNKKPKNLENIKKEILNENKNDLEWIEIIESGVKYIVKVEERIENKKISNEEPVDIVAKTDGLVKKIIASNGIIVAEKETYVKKGDTLITGIINDKKMIHASGKIYANVWYKINVSASLHEKIKEVKGNSKNGFKIKFFNKNYELYKKYPNNEIKENIIFKHNLLPFYLSYDNVKEVHLVDHILTVEEGINRAISKAKEKIKKKLKEDETIISEKQLKVDVKDSKIIVEVLITTYEDISEEKRIEVDNVQGDNKSGNQ